MHACLQHRALTTLAVLESDSCQHWPSVSTDTDPPGFSARDAQQDFGLPRSSASDPNPLYLRIGDAAAGIGGDVQAPHAAFRPLLHRPPHLPSSSGLLTDSVATCAAWAMLCEQTSGCKHVRRLDHRIKQQTSITVEDCMHDGLQEHASPAASTGRLAACLVSDLAAVLLIGAAGVATSGKHHARSPCQAEFCEARHAALDSGHQGRLHGQSRACMAAPHLPTRQALSQVGPSGARCVTITMPSPSSVASPKPQSSVHLAAIGVAPCGAVPGDVQQGLHAMHLAPLAQRGLAGQPQLLPCLPGDRAGGGPALAPGVLVQGLVCLALGPTVWSCSGPGIPHPRP